MSRAKEESVMEELTEELAALEIDRDELLRAKQEFGITDTESAAASLVRNARVERDATLEVAKEFQAQRDYWRNLAMASSGVFPPNANVELQQKHCVQSDRKLADCVRAAKANRAENASVEMFDLKAAVSVVVDEPSSSVSTSSTSSPESTPAAGKSGVPAAGGEDDDGADRRDAGSLPRLRLLANYFQQMALLSSRLVEQLSDKTAKEEIIPPAAAGGGLTTTATTTKSPWARQFLERVIPAMRDELNHERLLVNTRQREADTALAQIRTLLDNNSSSDADLSDEAGGIIGSPDDAVSPGSPLARSASLTHRGNQALVGFKFDLNAPLTGNSARDASRRNTHGASASVSASSSSSAAAAVDNSDGEISLNDLIQRRVLAELAAGDVFERGTRVVVDYFRTATVRDVRGHGGDQTVEVKYDDGERETATVPAHHLSPYEALEDEQASAEQEEDAFGERPAQPQLARHISVPVTHRDLQKAENSFPNSVKRHGLLSFKPRSPF